MKKNIYFIFTFVITTFFFSNFLFSEGLPEGIEKEIQNSIQIPVKLLKLTLTTKENTTYETGIILDPDEEDEEFDLFKEPLYVTIDGKTQLNPNYREWYSKLHNLLLYQNLLTGRKNFLQLPATTTNTVEEGTTRFQASVNWTSIFDSDIDGNSISKLDGEVIEAVLSVTRGITDTFEIELFANVRHNSAGRTDAKKNSFEEFLGLSTGARGKAEDDQYSQVITIDGKKVHDGKKNKAQLGDTVLTGKWRLKEEGPGTWRNPNPSIAILGAIKLPTGDVDDGFGSGTTDLGASLVLSKHITKRLKTHLNLGAARPGGNGEWPNTATNLQTVAALEYAKDKENHYVFQVNYSQGPFHRVDFDGVNQPSLNVGISYVRHNSRGSQFRFYFLDELSQGGDTDWVFGIAWEWWPGDEEDEY